jgi:magnesium transporter
VITSYLRKDGTVTSPVSEDAIRQTLAAGEGLLWIDLEAASQDEATPLLRDIFGFHHLAIEDCFNTHIDPAKIDDYGDYVFIIAQAISSGQEAKRIETTELNLFLGPNYVVSFHGQPLPFIEEIRRRCEKNGLDMARGADFLAHSLIDELVDDYQPLVEELDDALQQVEEQVLAAPRKSFLEDILLLKRNVQRLRRTLLPQRDMVNRIARGEFPKLVRQETYIYFRDVYDHVVRVEEMVESVRDLADGVLNSYLSSINNRMNDVMKTLSVVATILLPLTFIASIYGMNFQHMPELTWRYGYYVMLGVMATIAFTLVVIFRRRRWF